MTCWTFSTCAVHLTQVELVSSFADGRTNRFWLPGRAADPQYLDIVRWAGYGADWHSYAVEHDLTHHWLADRLGWPWSWAVHDGDGSVPLDCAEQRFKDEEHLVNRLQRYSRIAAPDEYGVLEKTFPRLPDEILSLRRSWAPLGGFLQSSYSA